MAESLSGYIQLEEDMGLQFNFFSIPSGKFSQNYGRTALLLFATVLALFLGIVPNCRTSSPCQGWEKYFPTDLEFKEELTNATLRGAGCYSNPLPSRITDLTLLDGVDPYADLSMEVDCSLDSSTLQDEIDRGRKYVRMLDLSRGNSVSIIVRFIRSDGRCGIVVRPRSTLNYETFYALYLMRGPATDNFDEPREFRALKWKAFRNNIDTETDELYRDALTQASERWGTHPDSFRMIQAFTTRSFRSVTVPSITGRNQYFAAARNTRLIGSLDKSPHPLANFMLDAHNSLRIEDSQENTTSEDSDPASEDAIESRRQTLALRNIRTLGQRTGLRAGFVELNGACTTVHEPELCDYREVEIPELHLRYIPFLYTDGLQDYRKVLIMPLSVFTNSNRAAEIRSWKARLQQKSVALVIYLGPDPVLRLNEPDHLQKELLQGALSFSALPLARSSEVALYCEEIQICPLLGLYSRNVSALVGSSSWMHRRASLRDSFPPEKYRTNQLRLSVLAPFRFQSFLLEPEKTLIALRKGRFSIRKSREIDSWFNDRDAEE
ncbi:MAG: hypothetical protein CMF59_00825 [Leptospiraceae bacterium]|nr:hypothetical protein [Leptospiraceae bacterium]